MLALHPSHGRTRGPSRRIPLVKASQEPTGAGVLGSDDIDRLAADGRVETVARRTVLPLDGPTVAIVIGGYFRIFRNAAFVRDVTLGLAGRGDVLAPGAAFGDRSAETGAEALCESHVLLLSAEAWNRRATAQPELNLKMAASVGRRVTRLQKKLEEFSRAGVEARVAATLLELAADHGTTGAGGIKLDLPLSQEDLARLAGTTRETCSSTVAEFARRGLVKGGRLKGMLVLDPAALSVLAQAGLEA
jgi:CRP-like cAMP-binding protein